MLLLGLQKQITKFVERKFQGRSEKFYEAPDCSFEVSILGVILNFEVSDQSSEIRGSIEPFLLYGSAHF